MPTRLFPRPDGGVFPQTGQIGNKGACPHQPNFALNSPTLSLRIILIWSDAGGEIARYIGVAIVFYFTRQQMQNCFTLSISIR